MAQELNTVKSQLVILERCASDLQECSREILKEFQESQVPVTDDDSVFHRFCAKLEFLLQHKLKDKSGILSGKKSYWDYFCRCLVSHKTSARDGIKFVKSLSELKTSVGKGRAFLRFCLVHQCLADTLQQCLSDLACTTEFYHPDAALLQSPLSTNLLSTLYDLSSVQFDLAPTGYDFDVAFPSFARKTYGTPYSWRSSTPNRTISVSSFSLSTPQSLSSSFPRDFAPSSENGADDTGASSCDPDMEQQVQELQLELARAEGVKASLCMSVSTLGEERQALEDKVADLEGVVVQVKKDAADEKEELRKKCAELEAQLTAYRNEEVPNNKVEALERLNTQLSIRLTTTEAEREDLQNRLEQVSGVLVSGKEQCKMYEIQVSNLKEAAALSRQMLAIRDLEVRDLREQVGQISQTLHQIEEYKLFSEEKAKWSTQLKEIKLATQELHTKWSQEKVTLEAALQDKEHLCQLSVEKYTGLENKFVISEQVVEDQQKRIEKLQTDLVATLEENKQLNNEMQLIQKLLGHHDGEIETPDLHKCFTITNLPELSEPPRRILGSQVSIQSVSVPDAAVQGTNATFIQLRGLISEKKSLICEVKQLKELNAKLELTLSLQERRLSTVTMELNKTWSLISKLKIQHGQLHTSECVLRYELSEKRKVLNRLKEELETWRQKWASIREKNVESEQVWQSIRDDFDARKAGTSSPTIPVDLHDVKDAEQPNIMEEGTSPITSLSTGTKPKRKLPPIDLVSEIDTDNSGHGASSEEESEEDVRGVRLKSLEEQSQLLYSKLMASTTRSINIAAKLAELHDHYGANQPEEDLIQVQEKVAASSATSLEVTEVSPSSVPPPPPLPPALLVPSQSATPTIKLACTGATLDDVILKPEEASTETTSQSLSKLLIEQLPRRLDVLKREKRVINDQLKVLDLRLKVLKTELERAKREKEEEKQAGEEHVKVLESRERDLCDQIRSLKEENATLQFQLSTQALEYEKAAQMYLPLLQAYNEHQDLFQTLEQRVEKHILVEKELERLLADVKREREIEKAEFVEQLETMRMLLATREEECQGLSDELKQSSAELNEIRVVYRKMDDELKSVSSDLAKKEADFHNEVTLLRDESVQLRQKIIKLIKEKDMLWQRTDRLLHLQRVQASDMWMPDRDVSCCLACRSTFTFLLRKHHCRLCGRIFCHRCADNWIMTAASNRRARVCNECFIVHRDMGSESSALVFSQDSDVGDSQEQHDVTDLFQSDSSPNSSSVSSPTTNHILGLQMEGNNTAVDEGTFAVLSDEEITRSLSASSPYAQSPVARGNWEPGEVTSSPLRTLHEIQDYEGDGEAWINAGNVYKIPISVDKAGVVLQWEFRTEPKSMAFSVVYECVEDEEENRILVETTHVASHLQTVEGSLTCQKPGTYCLIFDNSLSRFLAKKITYNLSVLKTQDSHTEETPDTG